MARRVVAARPDSGELARFEARLRARRPALTELLGALYPAHDVAALVDRVVEHARRGWEQRKPALVELDVQREADPRWYQRSDRIGYVAYADRFGGTLGGVAEHLDHLAELDVTYFHLMYVLRAREGANDGGYAVVAYDDVEPRLGTRDDLESLADQLRERGISLCLDLVLNHTAREHPWAIAARAGSDRHRAYYLAYPDRTMPDRWEATLPETFPHLAPGNFTWDPEMGAQGAGAWVWTTFNTYQWDLNYANPDVFVEMLDVMIDLANLGVEVLRLDAIAFTWKRLGTNCQNQPEAHLLSQAYRAIMEVVAPAVLLKAEAIVGPGQLVQYLGAHRSQRDECHVAYHNQLMVQLWSSLATQDAKLATASLASLPPTPPSTTWVTYLRCHDDIGWAIEDRDCAALGWNGWAHRNFLCDFYTGQQDSSFAEGTVFEQNPITGDRRINGTAASLCGVGRTDQPLAVDRLLCAYTMVMGMGGVPLIFMGDEIALCNDADYANDPHHCDDNRWINRPLMPWEVANEHGDFSGHEVYDRLRHLIAVRKDNESLHASIPTEVHATSVDAVTCFVRHHPAGDMTQVYNVADHAVSIPAWEIDQYAPGAAREVLSGEVVEPVDGMYHLAPYATLWLVRD